MNDTRVLSGGQMANLETRICRVCGQIKNLNKFVISKTRLYGRDNVCKNCDNLRRRAWYVELIEGLEKPIRCHICQKEITVLEGVTGKSLIIHSLDGDHENWDKSNKVPTHRTCHSKNHFPIGEDNPNWKGEEAQERTKRYSRKYYPKRRMKKQEKEKT